MIRSQKYLLIVLLALIIAISSQACADVNCKKCSNLAICDLCSTNFVLLNNTCQPCSAVLPNCNVCNDTVLPLQCISCGLGFYGNSDFSVCQTCGSLIQDCAQCEFQAPFQKVKCSLCIDDLNLSDDKYSCVEPLTVTIIIVAAVIFVVLGLLVGGFFLRRWMKKKKLENPLVEEDEYEKAT